MLQHGTDCASTDGLFCTYFCRWEPRYKPFVTNPNEQNRVRGSLFSMIPISVADILEFPVQERIQLVEVIWESIVAVPHARH